MAYRGDMPRIFAHADLGEQKQFLRIWMDEIKLAPETLEVEIRLANRERPQAHPNTDRRVHSKGSRNRQPSWSHGGCAL